MTFWSRINGPAWRREKLGRRVEWGLRARSEFSYGSFVRTVSLPEGADEDDIKATYDEGILTVSVRVSEPAKPAKHIQVATN
ncbi:Alpha-crystallin [Mycobacterium persicum]|uniref:Alpha-crystallin n=1 Tax=Mycobacterium persicum TaxID=1487726 RepID=A0AB38URY1_9MYCO|nr:Alpha-crystallin [Mycobacterium persicum]